MTFNPSSTICLCNVPIDNTYKHQIYFATYKQQREYFEHRVVKTFSEYLTVRKTLADGSLQSSVKVSANIDSLYNCNYMYYQNANHGTRYFYAFITKLIYINEGTTEIVFETDVYQTWRWFTELKESYVVREHSVTDKVGDNVVPESFNFQEYEYVEAYADTNTVANDPLDMSNPNNSIENDYGYIVGTSERYGVEDENSVGFPQSGLFQGVYYYFFEKTDSINQFINSCEKDSILFITVIPKFNLKNSDIVPIFESNETEGAIIPKFVSTGDVDTDYRLKAPAQEDIELDLSARAFSFGGYTPINKKLYTNPFYNLTVTNHNGDEAVYNLEEFANRTKPKFSKYGDISANPSVTLIPRDYKGLNGEFDFGVSLGGFPQCSFNIDTYKLWLAKNQFGVNSSAALSLIGGMVNVGAGVASGNVPYAAMSALNVASTVTNTINTYHQAKMMPNKVNMGSGKNNLLTAMRQNMFVFYIRTIKREYAEMLDDFFTMFGYQTNKLKVPNISARPYFNYVQTVDCNIIGAIPDDDMVRLKGMYNHGVTLWRGDKLPSLETESSSEWQANPYTVGSYSVDNSL